MIFNNLDEVLIYFQNINKGNEYLDYILSERTISKEWYEAILEKVKKHNPKRVIDIGSNANLFGYLFANEGIEYIGIDEEMILKPIEGENIKFIHSNYYDVREKFKDDIIISCLCVGYLIPVKDVLGRVLIVNDHTGNGENFKCTAKEIILKRRKNKWI